MSAGRRAGEAALEGASVQPVSKHAETSASRAARITAKPGMRLQSRRRDWGCA